MVQVPAPGVAEVLVLEPEADGVAELSASFCGEDPAKTTKYNTPTPAAPRIKAPATTAAMSVRRLFI